MARGREICRFAALGVAAFAAALGVAAFALFGPSAVAAPADAPGCTIFPADNVWHSVVAGLPVHSQNRAWAASLGAASARLAPEFSVPVTVVAGTHDRRAVQFEDAGSDPGPYPVDAQTTVESGASHRAVAVDRDACVAYELWHAELTTDPPRAGAGAVFDLKSNRLRPAGKRSADAGGLPLLAGLVRRDEVANGFIDHAIRMSASRVDGTYLWPARTVPSTPRDLSLPPMGARFRLRSDFDMSQLRIDTQTVLRAMQRYGVIVADVGPDWSFSGAADGDWSPSMLSELAAVPARAFEAVDAAGLMQDPNSGAVRPPAPPPPPPTSTTRATAPRPTTTTTTTAQPVSPASPMRTAPPQPIATTTTAPEITPSTEPVAHVEPVTGGSATAPLADPTGPRDLAPDLKSSGLSFSLLLAGLGVLGFGGLMGYIRTRI